MVHIVPYRGILIINQIIEKFDDHLINPFEKKRVIEG